MYYSHINQPENEMQDWKAQQAARQSVAAAAQAANPHLVPVGEKVDSLQAAAKNIRIELARAFPGVKFSVKSSRFSGGDSITVRWIDGPTSQQVDDIADKYQAGSFNGMEDIYEYSHSAWRDAFGDAKYVHSDRENSDRAIASAIRTVCNQYGMEAPAIADFRAGKLWGVGGGNGCRDLQSLIHQCAARRTWMLSKTAKSETVAA
jgi:hypothetical protein